MGKGTLQFCHPREERGKRGYLQIEPSQGFKAKCCPKDLKLSSSWHTLCKPFFGVFLISED
jgi:hypothetical protein